MRAETTMNATRADVVDNNPAVFALGASRDLGESIASCLGITLSEHEERSFEDGEHKTRTLVNVRERDVFVVHSLYSDETDGVNDKFCRLLFFIGSLKDASAARVTAVVPYLAYARKDKKSQTRDPVTTRYVAQLFEAVGTNRLVTLDVHNVAAFQNAFRITTDHLEGRNLFADHFAERLGKRQKIAVVSPDLGGTKRADVFRIALERRVRGEVGSGFMEKARARGVMTAGRLVGDVEDASVIILDDIISTGGTIVEAARACKARGAREVYAAATHGIFVGKAEDALSSDSVDAIVVADTVPPFRLSNGFVREKVQVLSTSNLLAESIRRIHEGGSIVDLLA
jgi:ribose-phosphate pyrophosphokinase